MNEQSKGYWKHGSTPKSYVRTCSVCGSRVYIVGIGEYPYCPYCKAEMNPKNNENLYVKRVDIEKAMKKAVDEIAENIVLSPREKILISTACAKISDAILTLKTKEIDK